ncbi:MAG TPA: carboxypeptidase-like regulatory domain-containing protein [Candidatus Angelobacter sp.]|nr:carboxypeptidase-like regulatory domain-containing protein [Candidatus Angelobacter sp.]
MAASTRTILLALALAAPLGAQTDNPQPAIVEGSVINAQNSRTIPRASVTLLGLRGVGNKSVRADGTGHFIFERVDPGTYRLVAERQGFYSDERKREFQPLFDVSSGQHLKDMPVRLMPTAVVTGQIVDEYEDPLQNIEVKLLAVKMKLGQPQLIPAGQAVTDDRGEYRVSGLKPGKYYVAAEYRADHAAMEALKSAIAERIVSRAQSGGPRQSEAIQSPQEQSQERAFTYAPLFYPSTEEFQQAQALQLNPGDETAANFIFMSAPVVSIKGRVTNGITGTPPAAAAVSAYWSDYIDEESGSGNVVPADGTFEIRGLAPGPYTLRTTFTEEGATYVAEKRVEVGTQGAQNVQLAGLPDFDASGHVAVTGLNSSKVDRVTFQFVAEGNAPRVNARAMTPEFTFDAQLRPDRRYRVHFPYLPEDYYLQSVRLGGHDVPADNLVVSGKRGDLELTLSPSGAHIEGTLVGPDDQPTRGSILLVPDVPEPGPAELFRRARSDGKGVFVFRGVAPGTYRLVALVNINSEIEDTDFLKTVSSRGESLMVEESGVYKVRVKLDSEESQK